MRLLIVIESLSVKLVLPLTKRELEGGFELPL